MNGIELKLKRVEAGVSQAHVAALLGVSQTVLYAIASGSRSISDDEESAVLEAIDLAKSGKTAALVPLFRRR